MKRILTIFTVALVALIPIMTAAYADELIPESIVFKSIYSDLKLGSTPDATERIINSYKTKFKVFQVKELRMVSDDPPKATAIIHDNGKEYLELHFKKNKLIGVRYFYAGENADDKSYRVEISKNQIEDGVVDRFIYISILKAYREPKDVGELLEDFLKIAKNYVSGQKPPKPPIEIRDLNITVGEFLSITGRLLINPEGWE